TTCPDVTASSSDGWSGTRYGPRACVPPGSEAVTQCRFSPRSWSSHAARFRASLDATREARVTASLKSALDALSSRRGSSHRDAGLDTAVRCLLQVEGCARGLVARSTLSES